MPVALSVLAFIVNRIIRRKLAALACRAEARWALLEHIAFHVLRSPLGSDGHDVAGRIALEIIADVGDQAGTMVAVILHALMVVAERRNPRS